VTVFAKILSTVFFHNIYVVSHQMWFNQILVKILMLAYFFC